MQHKNIHLSMFTYITMKFYIHSIYIVISDVYEDHCHIMFTLQNCEFFMHL